MYQTSLEPRPLYGIGTVARLTGLKPDTLRVWERRYGLGASHKSATGRRQYTQGDLEHLQLVSALVSRGTRIGEIASSERKTLEVLMRGYGQTGAGALAEPKPRVVFVGEGLCGWLDQHQGCLANVDAQLARFSLNDADLSLFEGLESVDALIVECATLGNTQMARVSQLREHLNPGSLAVMYQFASDKWLKELGNADITPMSFPPEPASLAFHLTRIVAEKTTSLGESNLGELIRAKPRQFTGRELNAARLLKGKLECECPKHIADLIEALANFEEYSSNCSVDNWHEAAVHSCMYAYTGQARWLMEKALSAVLEDRSVDFAREVQKQEQHGAIGDAA